MILSTHNLLSLCALVDHIYSIKDAKIFPMVVMSVIFEFFNITSMAANSSGDTLFVATLGAGVGRITRDDVDGISGASNYAQWGPCLLPSDNVYSVCITGDVYIGTDKGFMIYNDGVLV